MIACKLPTLNLFEKNVSFEKHEWKSNETPSFLFTITDTTAYYHIYVTIRHSDAYRYSNLWLDVTTKAPSDTAIKQQLDITLANNNKGWLGTGMDDIFAHQIKITQQPIKLKKGDYQFTLKQTMREDPLQYILNAGIRVEKVQL